MKTILLSLIFSFLSFSFFFHNSQKLRGFLVIKYRKDEIEFKRFNDSLRNQHKSFSRMIDLTTEEMFFPIDEGNIQKKILEWKAFGRKEIYFLPAIQNKMYFEKYNIEFINLLDLSKQINCKYKYYQIKNEDAFLYKIYYIEGYEIVKELENNDINKFKLDLYDEIDKNADVFNVHFIYKVDSVTCNIHLKDISEWKY